MFLHFFVVNSLWAEQLQTERGLAQLACCASAYVPAAGSVLTSCALLLFADGTFFGDSGEQQPTKRSSTALIAVTAGAVLALTALVAIAAGSSGPVSLVDMDRKDGTDALVNAVLVARGDALPTEFAADRLNINPELPFLGSSAYHANAPRRSGLKQARMQALAIDPATQFCSDPADCIRDLPYFKSNALWHQAAHDMMVGANGPAMPPNAPGYAWCDYTTNPSC